MLLEKKKHSITAFASVVSRGVENDEINFMLLANANEDNINAVINEWKDTKELKILQEICTNAAGNAETFAQFFKGVISMAKCVENLTLNILSEHNKIKSYSASDEYRNFFKLFCDKKFQAIGCLQIYIDAFDPCLHPEKKNNLKIFENIVTESISFVCNRDGEPIISKSCFFVY